jgi:alanyl-tRNA synthetase
MQNIRAAGGSKDDFPIVGELPAKNIDTGLGLERTAALLQGVENIYEIDTTKIILDRASELSNTKYGSNPNSDVSLRVVADHARTAMMLIGDGVNPGNEGRGYVLRRMMRRTIRNMRLLGSQELVLAELVKSSIAAMAPQYPELISNQDRILEVTVAEEESFIQTLKSGTSIFDLAANELKSNKVKSLPADTAFKLHDTYGFPFDLTLEMAREKGLEVDENGFRKLMKEQKERAQADARTKKSGHTDLTLYKNIIDKNGATQFVGYENNQTESKLTGILVEGKSVSEAGNGAEIEVTLNRTPFYAEGGGQIADGGFIKLANGAVIEVEDVQTPVPGLIVHRGRLISGAIKIGEDVIAQIDQERRTAISRAHTATHMVHKAFRETLGETATQAGSENSPGRFRFDFPATSAVPQSVLNDVESRVNELLISDLEVNAEVMTQDKAKSLGAMALFGEKYGDQVRVVSVGDWAKELCGGTHVGRSGELGVIKLMSESSIGSGVRRVEALVGVDAYKFLVKEHMILNSITQIIKGARSEEIPERVNDLIDKMKVLEKELSGVRVATAMNMTTSLISDAVKIGSAKIVSAAMAPGLSAEELRTVALKIKNEIGNGVVVLTSLTGEKIILIVAVSNDLIKLGVKAGDLVKAGSTTLGGGGGGKDDFAQGGGVNIAKLSSALSEISNLITAKLK